jgi:radial spoke head protein 9
MAFYSLETVDQFNLAGFTLNTEELGSLRASLQVKKAEEKLQNLSLWGKLLGTTQDYFIAQSFDSEYFKRKYYYTLDLSTWLELPVVTEHDLEAIESIQSRLTGDPATEHVVPKKSKFTTDIAGSEEEEQKIQEDVRIAGIIQLINNDVEIVPRKAYYRDSSMKIKPNLQFNGLEPDEIGLASSYMHFKPGFQPNTRTLSERMNTFDESIDIFESIAKDEPHGKLPLIFQEVGQFKLIITVL